MKPGFMTGAVTDSKRFASVGGAREWRKVDYVANGLRMRLVGGAITTVEALDAAITAEIGATAEKLNEQQLRDTLKEQLLLQYSLQQLSDFASPAMDAAIL